MSRGPGNAPPGVGNVEEYRDAKDRMEVFDSFPPDVRDTFNDLKSIFSILQVAKALEKYDADTVVKMLKVKDRQRTKERYDKRGYDMDGFI
jgi:hypothetical protein